jgi:DNA-binding NarL/FixJ family response regulator
VLPQSCRMRSRRQGELSSTGPVRVLVADDQAAVRSGFAMLLGGQPDIAVVGEAENGMQAVMLCRALHPDVVLMDVRMPVMDGLEATRRIIADASAGPARVVILTTFDLDEYVYEALRAGACGFLLKHARPEELLLGVRAAAEGGALLSPAITRRLIGELAARAPGSLRAPDELARLTGRELEVFQLLIRGLSNAEIARTLVITGATVKSHVAHALAKLGLRDRVQGVLYAYETGLLTPGEAAGSFPRKR